MKKVLMVGPSYKLKGGVATVINNYRKYNLDKRVYVKYFSTIFTNNNFINVILFPIVIIKYIFLIIDKDIIHIHMASNGSFKRKATLIHIAKKFNKNIIIHLHGAEFHLFYENSHDKYKKYITDTLNKANYIIALSNEWKDRILKLSSASVKVIYNSVQLSRSIHYNLDGKEIIFIGRLEKRKGIYDLLEIANDIKKIDDKLRVILCGDGDIDNIKDIVKRQSLNNVIVKGWIGKEEKEKLFKDAIINILPSYNEGMPMSILEAMANGIPTITTDVGGIPQVIVNEENGFMVKPGDKKSVLINIERLIKNRELREHISKNAYKTIKMKFDIEKHINTIVDLYYSM